MIIKNYTALLIGVILMALGNTIAYFQNNGQIFWPNWKNNTVLYALVLAIPTTLCFIFSTKYIYEATHSIWSIKIIGFVVGVMIYYMFTSMLSTESILTTKNLICVGLALIILYVQLFYK
jgi:peptidoglycan/LPS O-acetylase OafA/YrhL